jgi:hypothetical protein
MFTCRNNPCYTLNRHEETVMVAASLLERKGKEGPARHP